MIETDVQSRTRLFFIGGFLLLLFGGFAISGLVQRFTEQADDPAPTVTWTAAEHKAWLAERKLQSATIKKMAASGKAEKWSAAITIADNYLTHKENVPIRLLRAEALLHQGKPEGGVEMAKLMRGTPEMREGEVALLQGDEAAYRRDSTSLLSQIDESKAPPVESNNVAWWYAVGANPPDKEITAKAVRLAEKAVADARAHEDVQNLATYTNTLGAIYLRAGRDKDALMTISESERLRHDPFNYPFLALAQWGLGDKKDAVGWRDRLNRHLADTYATHDGQIYRHELLLLWRETEQTIR